MTEIAHGTIGIEVNDKAALAALERLDAEYERTMERIDRQEADVKIGADLAKLKRDLKEADARVKEFEAKRAKASDTTDRRSTAASLTNARKRQKALQDEMNALDKVAKARKDENTTLKVTEQRLKAVEQRELARERVLERTERKRQMAARAEERANNVREKALIREQTLQERASARRNREIAEVPKLEAAYARLQQRLEKLDNVRRRARGDSRAVALVNLDMRAVESEIERVRSEVHRRIGRDPIGIPINLQPGRDLGVRLRNEFSRHGGDFQATLAALGVRGGEKLGDGVVRGFSRVKARKFGLLTDLGRSIGGAGVGALSSVGSKLMSVASNLSNMTVRLGPFTATIRQAIVGASLLAPIILDLVGALGSLVSVAGSAALGVGALGAGLAGGAIPAAIGLFTVLKPVVTEFKNAMKASKAYNDAVLQYGHGSDQATKKQKVLTNVLRGVDDQTRAALQNAGRLSARWKDLTAPARADVFHTMGVGLTYLNQNLDTFGQKTVKTTHALSSGLNDWISGLNSAEGMHILTTMWDNFNKSIGPVMHGLGQIAVYLGRVSALASGSLPGLAVSFDRWATSIKRATDGAAGMERLKGKVDGVVQSAKDVGRFFMSAGRLMKAFFGGGVKAGDDFVNTMTKAMDRWTAFLNTRDGQKKLQSFFSESVAGAQALWGALAPLVTSFVGWAAEIAPFSRAFFSAAGAVGSVVSGILKLTVLRGTLTAIAATLGALWSVSKISAGARALAGFAGGLTGVDAAGQRAVTAETELAAANERAAVSGEAAAAAANAQATAYGRMAVSAERAGGASTLAGAGGLGGAGRAAREGAQAEKAAASAGRLSRMSRAAGTGLLNLATGLTGLGPGGLVAAAGLAIVGTATYELTKKNNDTVKAIGRSRAAFEDYKTTLRGLPDLQLSTAQSALDVTSAQQRLHDVTHQVNKLQDEGKTHGKAYKDLLMEQRQATLDYAASKQTLVDRSNDEIKNAQERQKALEKEKQESAKALAASTFESKDRQKALNNYKRVLGDVQNAQNQNILASINHQRALKGIGPIAHDAAAQMAQLQRSLGKSATKKIALQFESPKDATRVAAAANSALSSGINSKRTVSVIANSKDAEQAVRRLNAIRLDDKNLNILERGGDNAVKKLHQITGIKLTLKQQQIAERGGPAVINLLNKLIHTNIPNKTTRIAAKDAATSIIHGVIGVINAVPTTHLTTFLGEAASIQSAAQDAINAINRVPANKTTHFHGTHGGFAGGMFSFAMGGQKDAMVERAYREAMTHNRTSSGSGRYSTPTLLVGEEHRNEYVIATNPAYRLKNQRHLRDAANDLGMNAMDFAKSGKAPKKKAPKPPKPPTAPVNPGSSAPHQRDPLGVPNAYAVGALPLEDVQKDVEALHSKYTKQGDAAKNLQTAILQEEKNKPKVKKYTKADEKRNKHHKAGHVSNQDQLDAYDKRHKDKIAHHQAMVRGGTWNNINYDSLAQQKKDVKEADADLKQITTFNNNLTHWNSLIAKDRTIMSTNAAAYARTGDPKYRNAWSAAQGDRATQIGYLKDALTGALTAASAIQTKWPSENLQAYIDGLSTQIEDNSSAAEDNTEPAPVYTADTAATRTIDDFLSDQNLTDRLSKLTENYALSQIDNVPDNPATLNVNEEAASLMNDATAADALAEFYRSALTTAQVNNESSAIITELANDYVGAKGTAQGIHDTINNAATAISDRATADVMNLGSARWDLFQNFASNVTPGLGAASLMGGAGPASIGAPRVAGLGAAGSTTTVNQTNSFTAPAPDPHIYANNLKYELQAAL